MPTSDNIPREENHRRAHCLSENLRFLLEGNAVSFGRIKCEHSGGDVNPAGNGRTIVFQQAYEFDGWRFLVTVANMKGIGVEFGDMTEFGKLSVTVNGETTLECVVTKGRGVGGGSIYDLSADSGGLRVGSWIEALDSLVRAIKDNDAAKRARAHPAGSTASAG